MIELNHLRHFYEVAKAGSFTAAARALHISQSALSKSVALLEARENVQLLNRSKKGVVLTPLGQIAFEHAEQIFATAINIESSFRNYKEICEGTLHLGASDHITNYIIAPASKKIHKLYPKLLPSIFSGTPHEVIDLILRDQLEFGISFKKLNNPGIIYEPIAESKMAIVYKTKDSLKIKTKAELVKNLGYISSVRGNDKSPATAELVDILGESPTIAFESSSQESQKRLCLSGVGFAYLARFMVEKEIEQNILTEFSFREAPKMTIYIARKKNMPLSFNARMFLKELGFGES